MEGDAAVATPEKPEAQRAIRSRQSWGCVEDEEEEERMERRNPGGSTHEAWGGLAGERGTH